MAFGSNTPFGLRPLFSYTGGNATQKLSEYRINPGYLISIFEGDLVVLSGSVGSVNTVTLYLPTYAQSVAGTPNTFTQVTPSLGVFVHCEYYDATNRLVFSKYWPAGTQVYPGTFVRAFVLDDPTIMYEIQVSSPVNGDGVSVFANGGGNTAAPIFPAISTTANQSSGIGSNYSIMGGGGKNFNVIPNPFGGFYNNNPTSTMVGIPVANDGNPVTVFGNNPYGGNPATGQSGAYLCVNTFGHNATDTFTGTGTLNTGNDYDNTVATLPLKAMGYSPNALAAPGLTLQTTPFISVLVMINNHVFKPGTPGQTFGA